MEKRMLRNIEAKQVQHIYAPKSESAAAISMNEKRGLNNDYIVSACLPYIFNMAKGVYKTTRFVSRTLKRINRMV